MIDILRLSIQGIHCIAFFKLMVTLKYIGSLRCWSRHEAGKYLQLKEYLDCIFFLSVIIIWVWVFFKHYDASTLTIALTQHKLDTEDGVMDYTQWRSSAKKHKRDIRSNVVYVLHVSLFQLHCTVTQKMWTCWCAQSYHRSQKQRTGDSQSELMHIYSTSGMLRSVRKHWPRRFSFQHLNETTTIKNHIPDSCQWPL